MEKKISIIIPVYNVEKYLVECLDSVITQSLQEIEIICVNDGSTDMSGDILSEYAEKDNRIVIINKSNGGLSSARNAGLSISTGKYILFLDSDDYLYTSEVLSVLYQKAEESSLDQLFFDAEVVFENDKVRKKNSNYITYYKRKNNYTNVVTGKDLFCSFQANWDFKPNACMQLFLRKFLTDNNLTFCENMLHEDEVFTLECVTLSKKAAYINFICLTRRIRDNSIMTTSQKAGSIYGYYYGIMELLEFAQQNLSIMDEPFAGYFVQRLGVMMELAARLYYRENETEKKKIVVQATDEHQFQFATNMYIWGKIVSLKESLERVKSENIIQEKKICDALCRIQNLEKQLNDEKETTEIIREELRQEQTRIKHIRQSKSFKIGKTVTWIPRKVKKVINENREQRVKNVYLIGTPEFGNLGDHMISEVELEFLKTVYSDDNIYEISMDEYWKTKDKLKSRISENDLLVFHGGGNVGNLWPKSEYIRRDAFSIWKRQKKIVMPQSIYFTQDQEGKKELGETQKAYKAPNLLLCCRDQVSYRFAQKEIPCEGMYVPDIVLFHKPLPRVPKERKGVLLCFRNDKEMVLTKQQKADIVQMVRKKYSRVEEIDTVGEKMNRDTRPEGLRRFFDKLCSAEIVITDRLHGMIFCALEGIPCIALDNSYQKVLGAYNWLEPLEYIQYISDVEELSKWLNYPWKNNYRYPYEKYREKFKPLLKKL